MVVGAKLGLTQEHEGLTTKLLVDLDVFEKGFKRALQQEMPVSLLVKGYPSPGEKETR